MSRVRFFHTTTSAALKHTCPVCGVAPGNVCLVLATSRRAKEVHVARTRLITYGDMTGAK